MSVHYQLEVQHLARGQRQNLERRGDEAGHRRSQGGRFPLSEPRETDPGRAAPGAGTGFPQVPIKHSGT